MDDVARWKKVLSVTPTARRLLALGALVVGAALLGSAWAPWYGIERSQVVAVAGSAPLPVTVSAQVTAAEITDASNAPTIDDASEVLASRWRAEELAGFANFGALAIAAAGVVALALVIRISLVAVVGVVLAYWALGAHGRFVAGVTAPSNGGADLMPLWGATVASIAAPVLAALAVAALLTVVAANVAHRRIRRAEGEPGVTLMDVVRGLAAGGSALVRNTDKT